VCGTLKQKANLESNGVCCDGPFSCFEMSGSENDHSDTAHEFDSGAVNGVLANCPICHPELQALYTKEGRAAAKTVRS